MAHPYSHSHHPWKVKQAGWLWKDLSSWSNHPSRTSVPQVTQSEPSPPDKACFVFSAWGQTFKFTGRRSASAHLPLTAEHCLSPEVPAPRACLPAADPPCVWRRTQSLQGVPAETISRSANTDLSQPLWSGSPPYNSGIWGGLLVKTSAPKTDIRGICILSQHIFRKHNKTGFTLWPWELLIMYNINM